MPTMPDVDELAEAWPSSTPLSTYCPAGGSVAWDRATAAAGRCTPFDQTEKAHIGRRSREWTAEALSELECVYEMARCLREIGEDRVPR